MKAVDSAKGRVSCQRLVVAVSLLGLAGCVSAVTDDDMAANAKKPTISAEQKVQAASAVNNPAAKQQQGHYVDPAVASATGGAVPAQPHTPGGPAQAYGAAADIGGLSTQPTAISAGTSSIYSTRPAVAAGTAATAGAPSQGIVPAVSSVYSAPAQAAQPQPVSAPVPVVVPVPAEQHSENRQVVPVPQHASEQAAAVAAQPSGDAKRAGSGQESEGTGVTLAAFSPVPPRSAFRK